MKNKKFPRYFHCRSWKSINLIVLTSERQGFYVYSGSQNYRTLRMGEENTDIWDLNSCLLEIKYNVWKEIGRKEAVKLGLEKKIKRGKKNMENFPVTKQWAYNQLNPNDKYITGKCKLVVEFTSPRNGKIIYEKDSGRKAGMVLDDWIDCSEHNWKTLTESQVKEFTKFMIGEYEVVKTCNGIKVGCTGVTKAQVKQVAELCGFKVS